MNMANEKIVGETAITEVLTLMKSKDNSLEGAIGVNTTAISGLTNDVSNLTTRMGTAEGNITTNANNISSLNIRVGTTEGDITTLTNRIGDLSSLTTTARTNLVAAINEVDSNCDTNANAISTLNNTTIPTLSLKSETGYSLNLELDTTNYKLVAKLYNKDNTLISTSDEIDLPVESMIVNASYDNTTKDLTFTLQNGNTIVVPLDDIVSGLASQTDLTALTNRVTTNEGSIATINNTIGTLSNLTTTDKTNLVNAINEVDSNCDTNTNNITNMGTRVTNAESAITTNTNNIGTLSSLTTSVQTNLVAAINEVDSNCDTNTSAISTINTTLESKIDGLVILSYGNSTWQDFINAYNKKVVVYCRASSNANPATGSQTRLAFMAYVNNETNPTQVEFQYVRSISSHSASQQGDQVFVYLLKNTNGGTWSVTTREMSTKIVAGTGLSSTYSSGTLTLTADTNNEIAVSTTQPTGDEVLWIDPTEDTLDGIGSEVTNQYSAATDKAYSCAYTNSRFATLTGAYDPDELAITIPYPTGFTKDNCVIISYMYKAGNSSSWDLYRFIERDNQEMWDLVELGTNGVILWGLASNLYDIALDYRITLMRFD